MNKNIKNTNMNVVVALNDHMATPVVPAV